MHHTAAVDHRPSVHDETEKPGSHAASVRRAFGTGSRNEVCRVLHRLVVARCSASSVDVSRETCFTPTTRTLLGLHLDSTSIETHVGMKFVDARCTSSIQWKAGRGARHLRRATFDELGGVLVEVSTDRDRERELGVFPHG